jgi:phosphoserine aminotransferase
MGVPKNFKVFFFQGGASLQFSAIPYNLLRDKKKTNYITTGAWSLQAIAEAAKLSEAVEAWPDSGKNFTTLPDTNTWKIDKDAAYFHYCDNETIHGVEFQEFPFELIGDTLLVCDMSSNMCTRPIDWDKYAVIYAGAQKNIGPAGACVTIIREDLIGHQRDDTPMIMDWKTFRDAPNQFHNTPSCWPIYVCGLNIAHMKKNGL